MHFRLANFVTEKFARTLGGKVGASGLSNYTKSLFDPTLDWSTLKWLIEFTSLPVSLFFSLAVLYFQVIVKGIMRADDALTAIEHGASAIVVSNHGGRQLDHAPATIEVLPEIARAVKNRVPILIDGGVRSGTDIFKAIALGATCVFVGRPIIYGLAVGVSESFQRLSCNVFQGEEGVKHVLYLLRTEFDYALKLSGCTNISEIHSNDKMVVHKSFYSKL
jgi:isopentenyl diphosphate isomerase/L-lactate dehydrogenase-like FMN-dependent dehydrogenase